MFLPGWSGDVKLSIPYLPTKTVQSATPLFPWVQTDSRGVNGYWDDSGKFLCRQVS
jgi:hypothetical protein